MRKLLSLVLVLSLVLGSMGMAFAAGTLTEGIDNTEVVKAVERLAAFGIVDGMEDGKYHPEQDVTRAQFAKLLVTALGLGSAADAAKASTQFSDIAGSEWFVGYVNVAAGQGLVKGYPDGTFQPNAKVSYAEAATMLVRALGYKDSFLPGSWPGNYVAKAADAKITDKVSFAASGSADRGAVAIMVNNTLDAKIVKVDTYEGSTVKYYESQKTLLQDKLEIEKYENVRVLATKAIDDGLDADEARVKFLKETTVTSKNKSDKKYEKNDEEEFDIAKDINLMPTMGEEVTLYLNDDDEIVYAESKKSDKAKFDYVEKFQGKDDAITEVSLVKFDDDYKIADDAVVYVLNDDNKYKNVVKDNEIKADVKDVLGHVGKFVIKNNEVVYAYIIDGNESYPWMLVKENDEGLIKGINTTDEKFDIDLNEDYDGLFVFDVNGNSMKAKDIKKGNLIYVQKQSYDSDDYAVVFVVNNNTVEGALDKVRDNKINVGSKEIKVTQYEQDGKKFYDAYYSINNDDDVYAWVTNSDWSSDMEDADDENVVAYLDAAGRIAYVSTEAKETSGYLYGIVTKPYSDGEKVKIYTTTKNGEGDEVIYSVEEDNNLDNPLKLDEYGNKTKKTRSTEIAKGDVVKFKLNKNGEIAEDELFVMDPKNFWTMQTKKDFGKDTIPSMLNKNTSTVQSFSVDKNIPILDAKNLIVTADGTITTEFDVDDDFGIVDWKDLSENNYDGDLQYFVFTDDDNDIDAKAIIFIGEEGASSTKDAEAIYVVDKWMKGGDTYVKYVEYDGDVVEKKVDSKSEDIVKKERPYVAKVKSDGKLQITSDEDFAIIWGVVEKKDGDIVTIKGKGNYKLSGSQTVVYEEKDKKSTSNIRKGDAIVIVVENDVNIRVVELLKDSEKDDVLDGTAPYSDLK
jgi:hypothetical protein